MKYKTIIMKEESLKQNYCDIILGEDDTIYLNIHFNGKDKIDFNTMNYQTEFSQYSYSVLRSSSCEKKLENNLNIIVNKNIKEDYCLFDNITSEKKPLFAYIYTNGDHKINFNNMRFVCKKLEYSEDFFKSFFTIKYIKNNINNIYISSGSKQNINTKEENELILDFINNNPIFTDKIKFIETGSVEDINTMEPFFNKDKIYVTMGGNRYYCNITTQDKDNITYNYSDIVTLKDGSTALNIHYNGKDNILFCDMKCRTVTNKFKDEIIKIFSIDKKIENNINIIIDEELQKDYCEFKTATKWGKSLDAFIYTNGNHEIDFKKLNYISYGKSYGKEFIKNFDKEKDIKKKIKNIYIKKKNNVKVNSKKDNEDIMNFINKNNMFHNKKIFINIGEPSYDKKDIETLEPFSSNENIYVTMTEFKYYSNIKEIEITSELINEIVKKIKKHDFTPIEKVLYAYDIIKTNCEYDKNMEKKMNYLLRKKEDIDSTYAILFSKVLSKLNINNICSSISIYGKTNAINIAYINDDYYDIDGIYYFNLNQISKTKFKKDIPIEDQTKELYTELYINNYEDFCKTRDEMQDNYFSDYDNIFNELEYDVLDTIEEANKYGDYDVLAELRYEINVISELVDEEKLLGVKDNIVDLSEEKKSRIVEYTSLLNRMLRASDFLQILFNVRKVQHKENNILYPLSTETLRNSLLVSGFILSNKTEIYEETEEDALSPSEMEEKVDDYIEEYKIDDEIRKYKLELKKDNKPTDEQ